MLGCECIRNNYQNSCTYILHEEYSPNAWLIDCGDADQILDWVKRNGKRICGVFLTHCHLDHIYGVNRITEQFPYVIIYLSRGAGPIGIRDLRLNLSKYTADPYVVETLNLQEIEEGDTIQIFDDSSLQVLRTDGHSPDSMSYLVGSLLFTGDAYIPGVRVVTKLPSADKKKAQNSLNRILTIIDNEALTIMPGHFLTSKTINNV